MVRFVTACVFAVLFLAIVVATGNPSEACPIQPAKAVLNVAGNCVDRTHGLFRRVGHRARYGRVYYHTAEPAKAAAVVGNECKDGVCPAPASVGKAAPKAPAKK